MPSLSGWTTVTLGELGHWASGGTPSRAHPEYYGGEIPWVKTGDLNNEVLVSTPETLTQIGLDNSSAKLFPPGTLLIAMYGATIGKTALLGISAATNQACAAFVPDDENAALVPYLWKFAIAKRQDLVALGQGGAQPNISQTVLKQVEIPVPPLHEQKRIVAKLDALNEKSARARAELARIETLVTRYKQAVLAKAFNGELLHGTETTWSWCALGDVALDVRYGTAEKCGYDASLTPVLRIPNVADGAIDLSDLKYAKFDEKTLTKLNLELGDLLIVRSNGSVELVGKSAVVGEEAVNMLFAGYLIRFRFDQTKVYSTYVHFWLQSEIARREIETAAKSTSGVNNINSEQLKALMVPLPELEEQIRTVSAVRVHFSKIDRMASEAKRTLALLGKLDEAILAKAFRGELVPQDPNDEPASILLARIRAERKASSTKRSRKTKAS